MPKKTTDLDFRPLAPEELDFRPAGTAPPPTGDTASGVAKELGGQLWDWGKGMAQTVFSATPAGMVMQGAEFAKDPRGYVQRRVEPTVDRIQNVYRELLGEPQKNRPPETAPSGVVDRLVGAGWTAMGSDVPGARQLRSEGKPIQAVTHMLTGPVLSLELANVVGAALGTKPLPKQKRVDSLTKATSTGTLAGKDIPAAYADVMQSMDETVAAGLAKAPKDVPQLETLAKKTMGRLNDEYESALVRIENDPVTPLDVSNRILGNIKPEMLMDPEGQALAQKLQEAAIPYQQPGWTWRMLDDRRKRYYDRKKAPEAERIALRGDAGFMVDNAVENALRDMLYDKLGQVTGQLDRFRNIKKQQAGLFTLIDQLEKRGADLSTASAQYRATPWWNREAMYAYFHPEQMRGGVSVHPIRAITQKDPQKLATKDVTKAFRKKPVAGKAKRVAGAAAITGQTPSPPTSHVGLSEEETPEPPRDPQDDNPWRNR